MTPDAFLRELRDLIQDDVGQRGLARDPIDNLLTARRSFVSGELPSRDHVARLAKRNDFTFKLLGGKSFGHMLRQRTAERAHAFEFDRPAIAAVRRGREEKQLAAPLSPDGDDL